MSFQLCTKSYPASKRRDVWFHLGCSATLTTLEDAPSTRNEQRPKRRATTTTSAILLICVTAPAIFTMLLPLNRLIFRLAARQAPRRQTKPNQIKSIRLSGGTRSPRSLHHHYHQEHRLCRNPHPLIWVSAAADVDRGHRHHHHLLLLQEREWVIGDVSFDSMGGWPGSLQKKKIEKKNKSGSEEAGIGVCVRETEWDDLAIVFGVSERTKERKKEWTNEWTNERTNERLLYYTHYSPGSQE